MTFFDSLFKTSTSLSIFFDSLRLINFFIDNHYVPLTLSVILIVLDYTQVVMDLAHSRGGLNLKAGAMSFAT